MTILSALILSYLVGSIPFGYLAGKALKGIDIRNYGSGNLGATNVLRTLGPAPGIFVLLLDAGKGVFAVLAVASFVQRFAPPLDLFSLRALCGAAAISGHDWPVFLRFRGGKGVATGLGIFFSLTPLYAGISVGVFLAAVLLTRHVSVGSLALAACLPVILLIAGEPASYSGLGFFWLASVLYLHRENVRRLWHGTESRIGQKAQALPEDR